MHVDKTTYDVLNNFCIVNNGLSVKAGNKISTISPAQNVFVEAELRDEFPRDFAIYDLKRLLSTASLFDNPDIDFQEKKLVLTGQGAREKCSFVYSSPNMIVRMDEEGELPVPEGPGVVEFELTAKNIERLLKHCATMGLQYVSFSVEDGNVMATAFDPENPSSDSYVASGFNLSGDVSEDVKCIFKVETLKFLPGDYKVKISSENLGFFENKNFPIRYWIAAEDISDLTVGQEDDAYE